MGKDFTCPYKIGFWCPYNGKCDGCESNKRGEAERWIEKKATCDSCRNKGTDVCESENAKKYGFCGNFVDDTDMRGNV